MSEQQSFAQLKNLSVEHKLKSRRAIISPYGFIIFVLFVICLLVALLILRATIISNSNLLGFEIAKTANNEVVSRFNNEKEILRVLGHYANVEIEKTKAKGTFSVEHMQNWLTDNSRLMSSSFNRKEYKLFLAVDGKIIFSNNVWASTPNVQIESRKWYQEAMRANGETVLVSPYEDYFTQKLVLTMATKIGDKGYAIGCDIFTELQLENFDNLRIPEGYSFFVLDNDLNLLTFHDKTGLSFLAAQNYVKSFFNSVNLQHGDTLTSSDENFTSDIQTETPNGVLSVYIYQDKGTKWYTVLATPYTNVLSNFNTVVNIFIMMSILFVAIEVVMLYREYLLSKKIEKTTESLKVLGNSYEMILRVNFKHGFYRALKAPSNFTKELGSTNSYSAFMNYFKDRIPKSTFPAFNENYCLTTMEHLAINRISDMGHDFQMKNDDGKLTWFNVRILFDENMDREESILCFKEVDDDKIKEMEEHQLLRDALAMSHKNEEAKNVFFSNMSHDMRTPLNGIIGLCTIAQESLSNIDKVEDMLNKISSSSKQLLHLVDDILEVARPEKQQSLNIAPFKLKESVLDVVDVFTGTANQDKKKISVSFEIDHNYVKGDFPKIRQVINNLVSNSLKYSNEGAKIDLHIREVIEQQRPQFIFVFKDTGIGMSEEYLKNLFVPYMREERMRHVSGTGLGMPIVKNIINKMGGNIRVKSTLNVGTTFTVTLPLELAKEAEIQQIPNENLETQELVTKKLEESLQKQKNEEKTLFKLAGMSILLVEDNELNMEIATDLLTMRGVKVTQAWNGKEAVDVFTAQQGEFDAILMDMRMPVMDGCQASMAIRALGTKEALEVPIIAVTANAFAEDITATHTSGMNAHISKPIDFNILEKTLERLVCNKE